MVTLQNAGKLQQYDDDVSLDGNPPRSGSVMRSLKPTLEPLSDESLLGNKLS